MEWTINVFLSIMLKEPLSVRQYAIVPNETYVSQLNQVWTIQQREVRTQQQSTIRQWSGLVVERFGTYHTCTGKTRRLFQHNDAHDRECNSYGELPDDIRLASRITEVHTCKCDLQIKSCTGKFGYKFRIPCPQLWYWKPPQRVQRSPIWGNQYCIYT